MQATRRVRRSHSRSSRTGLRRPNREPAPAESAPDGETTPDHMGMPPQYEPQPLWPASGVVAFPHEIGDGFTGGTDINVNSFFVSSVYTDDNYNLLSVRVADNFYGYNGRDYGYSNLHYVDGVLCGGNGGSSGTEIYSRTCWIIGTDGETWMTSYSADISYEDLAGLPASRPREPRRQRSRPQLRQQNGGAPRDPAISFARSD